MRWGGSGRRRCFLRLAVRGGWPWPLGLRGAAQARTAWGNRGEPLLAAEVASDNPGRSWTGRRASEPLWEMVVRAVAGWGRGHICRAGRAQDAGREGRGG
jgi:hypothetical protein